MKSRALPLLVTTALVAAAIGPLSTTPLAAAPAAASATPADASKGGIHWEPTYAAAMARAQAENKPVVMKFYTGWCPFCTKMDKTTWLDASVAEAAKSFVTAKVNADVEAPPVARYRTTGYPTVIIAEPGGEQVIRLEGYKDGATVARLMKAYTANAEALASAHVALKQNKKDIPAMFTIADFQAGAGLHDHAADTYSRIAKAAQGADLVRALAGGGLALTRDGKPEPAAKLLARATEAGGGPPTAALLLALSENAAARGRDAEATGWRNRLMSDYPASPEAKELAPPPGS